MFALPLPVRSPSSVQWKEESVPSPISQDGCCQHIRTDNSQLHVEAALAFFSKLHYSLDARFGLHTLVLSPLQVAGSLSNHKVSPRDVTQAAQGRLGRGQPRGARVQVLFGLWFKAHGHRRCCSGEGPLTAEGGRCLRVAQKRGEWRAQLLITYHGLVLVDLTQPDIFKITLIAKNFRHEALMFFCLLDQRTLAPSRPQRGRVPMSRSSCSLTAHQLGKTGRGWP